MENKSISLSIDEAKYMYDSNDEVIRNIALKAYSKEQLSFDFTKIKTFEDACKALGLDYKKCLFKADTIANDSKASAAMYKLNIIRKALNLGQDLHLTKDQENSYIYYPYNPFVTKSSTYYNSEIDLGKMEVIGKIKSEGEEYNVLGGDATFGGYAGLGGFYSDLGVGFALADIGFLGCVSKEIAEHLGKYFGMLITEAKYGDMIEDFEIIESKYKN